MITNLKKTPLQKKSKGQIVVILALLFVGLIAIVGLAIDLGNVFVSYSRLRRAVDAAALSASGHFRQGYTQTALERAAQQFLDLNGIGDTTSIHIEACAFAIIPNDPDLCTTPARKLVRVTVTQDVHLFFLAVVGLTTVPIKVDAISEAASVDLVLLIDSSNSMAATNAGEEADPKGCNPDPALPKTAVSQGSCHPFEEIKAAALKLVDRLFLSPDGVAPGYDRVSIVTFDRFPVVQLEMTDKKPDIVWTINNLQVYQGEGKCPWPSQMNSHDWVPMNPAPNAGPNDDVFPGPCRLHTGSTAVTATRPDHTTQDEWLPDGPFEQMWCASLDPDSSGNIDPRGCMTTNSGGGLKVAGYVLGGSYPAGYPRSPERRETALWVVVWLTDGFSNAGFQDDGVTYPETIANAGTVICPHNTWGPVGGYRPRYCVDQDARPTVDQLSGLATPAAGAADLAARHPSSDALNYDPDDYARDMIEFVTNQPKLPVGQISGQQALLFTIGLGTQINALSGYESHFNLPPTGQTLLEYGAYMGHGIYYPAPSASQLDEIFLAIANKIATRLSR